MTRLRRHAAGALLNLTRAFQQKTRLKNK